MNSKISFYILNTSSSILLFLTSLLNIQFSNASTTTPIHNIQNETFVEIKGRIVDNKTKAPLVFADITIESTNIGTITNKEGDFTLKVPIDLKTKYISISFLGYTTKRVAISEFDSTIKTIQLKPVVTQLEQVNFVIPKDAASLVKTTLNNSRDSYLNDITKMTAFYRETIKKRRKNASLAEAVVNIYKQPYNTKKKDAIELVKSRKNTNYSRLDTIALKLQGGPFSALYADMIKYPKYVFSKELFDYYNFSFESSTQINNRKVFVVKFKQHDNVITPLYYGKLYIDAENFALVSAVYQLNVEDKDETMKLFLKRKPPRVKVEPIEAIYRVDYRNTNGKWHYSYSNFQLAFRVKWRRKLFGSTYTLNVEMAVTDWIKDEKSIDKANKIKPTIILSDEASGFSDPEFWGEYNIIEPEKSIESAIRKISKKLDKLKNQ